MKCPKCQTDNPEGSTSCKKCAAKLSDAAQLQPPASQAARSTANATAHHDDEEVRVSAAFNLGRSGDPGSVTLLIELTGDPSSRVRAVAAQSLGKLGDTSAVPALLTLLKDPVAEVVPEAVESLGRLRDERALEPLRQLEDRADAWTAKACAKAARRIRSDAEREQAEKVKLKEEECKRRKALRNAMESDKRIAAVLSGLKRTSLDNSWFDEEVVTEIRRISDYPLDGYTSKAEKQKRLEVGKRYDLHSAACEVLNLWHFRPTFHDSDGFEMTEPYVKMGGKDIVVVHGRLVITWRVSHYRKCATVVRIAEDEFFFIVDY